MISPNDRVRALTLDYFRMIGATIEAYDDDVYRIELDPDQAAELEGKSLMPWAMGDQNRVSHYFTFTPRSAIDPQLETVTLGSRRLQQIIASIRRHGEVGAAWLPATGTLRVEPPVDISYRPFLFFLLRLDRRPNVHTGSIMPIGVDLVEAVPVRQLAQLFPDLPVHLGQPDDPRFPVEASVIDCAAAAEIAYREVQSDLEREDLHWVTEHNNRIDREADRLEEFFRAKKAEGEEVSAEAIRRREELEQLRPQMIIRVQGMTMAHLPVAWVADTPHYLPFSLR